MQAAPAPGPASRAQLRLDSAALIDATGRTEVVTAGVLAAGSLPPRTTSSQPSSASSSLPGLVRRGLSISIDLDALLSFRSTWNDAPLARQKKQSRLVGFFWARVRRSYIRKNPALGLGKTKVVQIPTDYFPRRSSPELRNF